MQDATIQVWDLEEGRWLDTFTGHSRGVNFVALKDGKLISGGWDATIRMWDQYTGDIESSLQTKSSVYCATMTEDKLILGNITNAILSFLTHFKEPLTTSKFGILLPKNGRVPLRAMLEAHLVSSWSTGY